jgi:hypothetical protein
MSGYLQWNTHHCEWLRRRVEKGAILLDRVAPSQWRTKVNPDTLDISYGDRCILGQVFGDYMHGREMLMFNMPVKEGIPPWSNWSQAAADHGFLYPLGKNLEDLNNEWRLEVTQNRRLIPMLNISDTGKELLLRRVQRGIRILSENDPKWLGKVNLDTLDMSSYLSCVLGQLHGNLTKGREALKLETWSDIVDHGFGTLHTERNYYSNDLTEAWKGEIKKLNSV